MQPCGCEAGLGREAIEVDGAHLKARKSLFDYAFEVVELDGSRGVKGALVRKSAHGSEGERGAFFDFFCGAAEDGAEFEEAHVADVAMEIAGDR